MPIASMLTRRKIEQEVLKIVQTGDAGYRFGAARHYEPVLGKGKTISIGLGLEFSELLRGLTDPPCWASHSILFDKRDGQVRVWDMSNEGFRRFEFRDWMRETHMGGRIEIRRPIPQLSKNALETVVLAEKIRDEQDPEYDMHFIANNPAFYCTELINYIYERCGIKMPPPVNLRELPNWKWIYDLIAWKGKVNTKEIIYPGNADIGMRSSGNFQTVYFFEGEELTEDNVPPV